MASDSVEIVLNGVDRVSPVLQKVAVQLDKTGKVAKGVGGVFNVLGKFGVDVGPIGEIGTAIGEAADKSKGLSENLGKAGMAGLLLGSVVAGISLGRMFYEAMPSVEAYREKVAATLEQLKRDNELVNDRIKERVKIELEIAALQATPEQTLEVQTQALEKINDLLTEQHAEREAAQQRLKTVSQWFSGYDSEAVEVAKQRVEQAKAYEESLNKQRVEIMNAMNGEDQRLTAAKEAAKQREQDAANQKTVEQELHRLRMETLALQDPRAAAAAERERLGAMSGVTEEMRQQLRLEGEKRDAAEANKKQAEEQKAKAEQQAAREKDVINALELQLVALREGQAAADALKLAMDGLNEATIAEANSLREQIDAQTEYNNRLEQLQQSLDKQRETDQGYIEDLRAKNIELKHGADAAEEYRASLSGVSEAAIAEGKAIREENRKLEAQKEAEEKAKREREAESKKKDKDIEKVTTEAAKLSATEGRLLGRGNSNPAAEMAKKTEQLVNISKLRLALANQTLNTLVAIQTNTATPPEIIGT
jgi:hypothetical protein